MQKGIQEEWIIREFGCRLTVRKKTGAAAGIHRAALLMGYFNLNELFNETVRLKTGLPSFVCFGSALKYP